MSAAEMTINGRSCAVVADGRTTLLDVLREQCGLTSVKCGCGYGVCGACTILIDGKPARACLALALNCDGRAIVTLEGLSTNQQLHPINEAILAQGLQCGFCLSGIVLPAKSLLDEKPNADDEQIRECLSGTICRCTGYSAFVRAIKTVIENRRG